MSLLPLLIAMVLMRGEGSAAVPGAGKRGTRSPGWPSPKSPPPSGAMIPAIPPIPHPAEAPATPLTELHQQSATESPQHAAAAELYHYLTSGSADWGYPGRPSKTIQKYQWAMGSLTPDGIYGPKTQARGRALLGTPFPSRPGAKAQAASAAKHLISKGVPKLHIP